MLISELRALVDTKTKEVQKLLDEKNVEESKAAMEELRNLKGKLKAAEESDENDMRDLQSQRNKENGIDKMGELRMINKRNVSNLYKNDKNLDLGKYVRGALTGNWDSADNERNEFRALSTTTGQVLIPKSLSSEILAQVMNKSLIYGSGVPIVEMESGNLTIAKVKNNPVYGFKEELAAVTPQDATFEGVDLKAKMVYGLMKISIEALESTSNLTDVLKQAMGNAIADAIDKSMLYGEDPKDIKGLFTMSDINTIDAGELTNYKDFINGIGAIRGKNGEPTIMGVNADIDTKLNLLTNTVGDPLQEPKVISNLERVISNQLKADELLGADAIIYDPMALIIGQQVQFKFSVSDALGYEDGSIYLRVYSLLDMAAVRPEYITRIKGLK